MDHETLLAYLRSVSSLEVALKVLRAERRRYKTQRDLLCKPARIIPSELCEATPAKIRHRFKFSESANGENPITQLIGYAFLFFILSIILAFIACVLLYDVLKILPYPEPEDSTRLLWSLTALIFFVSFALFFRRTVGQTKDAWNSAKSYVEASENAIARAKADYNAALEMDQERLAYEQNLVDTVINPQIRKFSRQITRLTAKLDKLYAENIVDPNFRSLDAISGLYYYLSTGICSGLQGENGAYSKYNEDLRIDRVVKCVDRNGALVISRLDHIIENQNQMIRNQERQLDETRNLSGILKDVNRRLASISTKMTDTNQTLHRMLNSSIATERYLKEATPMLEAIRRGVDRTAYNSSVTALHSYIRLREEEGDSYFLNAPNF